MIRVVALSAVAAISRFSAVQSFVIPISSTSFFARRAIISSSSSSTVLSSSRVSSETVKELFNNQVTREFEASQLYLSASIWCDSKEYVGMASFMRGESNDERGHALAFLDFASKRCIPIQLQGLEVPNADWSSVEELWETLLEKEIQNSEALLALSDAAAESKDHAVGAFLQPYHLEQLSSQDHLRTILSKVRDESKTPGLIRQLDVELGGTAGTHGVKA